MQSRTWTVTRHFVLGGALAATTTVGVIVSFVMGHRTSVVMTTELADAEFASLRARFVDEQPRGDSPAAIASSRGLAS
jgi:hypothetical protein